MMKHFPHLLIATTAMLSIIGCSFKHETPLKGWQAIHANSDGDGWRGPVRSNDVAALADADAYALEHGVDREEIMVLAIYTGMDTSGQLPPNPLAERKLVQIVTLDSLTGYWEIIERSDPAITATYFLDVRANGKCTTNFGARFVDKPSDGFDRIEVLTDSSFALAITQGENYVFAVTRFDGDEMDVLLGGWKECPLSLTRTPHPSRLNRAEP